MVTQLQPDVRAYLHGGEVIKRYIKVEEVAYEYGFSVEETEYIAKAASSLYKLTRIHLVKKERFDEFMKHIYKVPGTNKQIIKKFARIGEACPNIFGINCQAKIKKTTIVPVLIKKTRDCHFRHYRN